MASFRNLPLVLFVAGLGVARMAAADEAAKVPAAGNAGAQADAKSTDAPKGKNRLDFPVPKGQPQKGLRIPFYGLDGKLLMRFHIGVAEVVDEDHVKLSVAHMETFKENGEHEYDVDLSDSVLNLQTQDLTSNVRVTIKCRDYEISGENTVFNLKSRTGKLSNGVKMVIYDARTAADEANGKSDVPTIEVKPVKEEKK
jgi:hypothetical protein